MDRVYIVGNIFLPFCSKPCRFADSSNCLIIATRGLMDGSGIYQYDLASCELKLLKKYSDSVSFQYNYVAQLIDCKNNVLYVSQGLEQYGINLNESEWFSHDNMLKEISDVIGISGYLQVNRSVFKTRSVWISSSFLYVIEPVHFLFDLKGQKFLKMNHSMNCLMEDPKLLFCSFNKKLMLVERSHFWTCYIGDELQSGKSLQWQFEQDMKIPGYGTEFDVVICKDLLFAFYWCDASIWCLDLFTEKWYGCLLSVPDELICFHPDHAQCNHTAYAFYHVGSTLMSLIDLQNLVHYKVDAYDLIPEILVRIRRKRYKSLIMGFMRENEQNKFIPSIPNVLKKEILDYFPFI